MRKTIVDVICSLLIVLFVYAAISKIVNFERFSVELGKSPILTAYASLWATLVPTAELLVSIMLATLRFKLIALYAAFSLMIMFTAYIVMILNFSDYVPCSCGGILQQLSWNEHLLLNVVFVFLSLVGILIHSEPQKHATSMHIETEGLSPL